MENNIGLPDGDYQMVHDGRWLTVKGTTPRFIPPNRVAYPLVENDIRVGTMVMPLVETDGFRELDIKMVN